MGEQGSLEFDLTFDRFAPLQEKKHQARRLGGPESKINVCRFQFRSCSIVKVHHSEKFAMVRSYSFGHIESVK